MKELNLSDNRIYRIPVLKKVKYEKLEKLNLENNYISIINLKKDNFKELNVYNNEIHDINLLEKVEYKY